MGKKKRGGRSRKVINLALTAAGINALVQFLLPYFEGQTLVALRSGDAAAIARAIHTDSQAALAWQNLVEALGPVAAIGLLRGILNGVHAPKARVGKFVLI